MVKISAIITAFKEPRTIGRAVEAIGKQRIANEIIVVAPDDETLDASRKMKKKYKELKLVRDAGIGKPASLNLAVSKARGDILILTDGDVFIGGGLKQMIDKFKDKRVGAVSGRPVSLNERNNKFGYWAYLLTEIANERRIRALKMGKRFFCSGYLFAIRKSLFPKLDDEILSEDGFVSHKVYEAGFKIDYCKEARVYVKYPDNFNDWIKQKKRSAGGYNQIRNLLGIEMRSFRKEAFGAGDLFKRVNRIKEIFWLIELYLARVYLWFVIYRDINMKKKGHRDIWLRVESTK